jgi:flagellar biosynthesis protein FliQ
MAQAIRWHNTGRLALFRSKWNRTACAVPLRTEHLETFNAMQTQDAIDLVRSALMTALIVGLPLLVVGMLVGLLISLIQALTQIQDQTVSTVPKLIAIAILGMICLPWMTDQMVSYCQGLILKIPDLVAGSQ